MAQAMDSFGRLDGAVFSGGRQADILHGFDFVAPPPASGPSFSYDAD